MKRFEPLEFESPLQVDAVRAATPADAKIQGVFLAAVVQFARLRHAALPRALPHFVSTELYSVQDYMDLLVPTVQGAYPELSLRQGLRRIGRRASSVLKETMAGKALHAVVADAPQMNAYFLRRGYELTRNHGRVTLQEQSASRVVVDIEDIHDFVDCLHVGVLEASVIPWTGGQVFVRRFGPGTVTLRFDAPA